MQYKYRIDHEVSLPAYCKSLTKAAVIRARDSATPALSSACRFLFIAGCGHSGTTLLAARFGNLSGVYVVPMETYVFRPEKSLAAAGKDLVAWAKSAAEQGMSTVVEKTPKHVHCWGRIRRFLPEAKLIVMVRNPLDTCASMKKRFGNLEFSIDRYCIDNASAALLMGQKNVIHLAYESFVTNPEPAGRQVLSFVGLQWEDAFVVGGTATYDRTKLTDNMLLRQQQVREPIRAHTGGWKSILTPEEADLVVKRTSHVARLLGYAEPEL